MKGIRMSGNGNQAVVARFWQEVHGDRNVDLVDELTIPSFMLHHLSNGREFNSLNLKIRIDAIHDMIPGFGASVDEQFTAGRNRVVAELTFRAPAPNGADDEGRSGESDVEVLEFRGIAICRFNGRKLTNCGTGTFSPTQENGTAYGLFACVHASI
jgi:hypothetical protein